MLAIICNLKFCHRFFQEENFDALSDSDFERLEENLEMTENLIASQRAAAQFQPENGLLLTSLDCLSEMVAQLWEQRVDMNFLQRLEVVAYHWV